MAMMDGNGDNSHGEVLLKWMLQFTQQPDEQSNMTNAPLV